MKGQVTMETIWREAAKDLMLDLVMPFMLTLPSGAEIKVRILVQNFGANKGMLVISDYSQVSSLVDELAEYGYGFSVMDEPLPGEEYKREDFIEVLRDWGWSGCLHDRPSWLR